MIANQIQVNPADAQGPPIIEDQQIDPPIEDVDPAAREPDINDDQPLLKHRILITLYDGQKRMCTTTLIFLTLYLSNFCSKKFILNFRFA